jgi:hypothetical protein
VEILTIKELDEKASQREEQIEKFANFHIYWELNLTKEDSEIYHKVESIRNRIHKKYGIEHGNPQVSDKMSVIFRLVDDAINRGVDFICLDSLNAIFGDVRSINVDQIRKLTKMVATSGVTLVVIHHTNKKNESAGRKEIPQVFDEVDHLRLDKSREKRGEGDILLLDARSRYTASSSSRIRRRFLDHNTPAYEILDNNCSDLLEEKIDKKENLARRIENIIADWVNPLITFGELKARLGIPIPEDGSIKNSLKKLADRGIVSMTDNKWGIITIPKYLENSASPDV